MKLHHLGIVVSDIKTSTRWWERVCQFRQTSEIIHDPIQKVRVQFFEMAGLCVELIEPASESSPMSAFLAEHGGGLYHLCFEVEDLDAAIEQLRQSGAFPIKTAEPAVAFEGRRIIFLVTDQNILIELVEAFKDEI